MLLSVVLHAQSSSGTLRLIITDPSGLPVPATVSLTGESSRLSRMSDASAGKFSFEHLPFGIYRVAVTHASFAPYSSSVEITSSIPRELRVQLALITSNTEISVADTPALVPPHETGVGYSIGGTQIQEQVSAIPNRGVLGLIDMQPGWIFEANGVLHPRGSEYQTQFVVDGMPIEENRSPAFAPGLETNEVSNMTVLTGTYPAEYGRKLGGIVEVNTQRDLERGWHGSIDGGGGSFQSADGSAMASYGWRDSAITVEASADRSDRYLDPPVVGNFTNAGTSDRLGLAFDRNLGDKDRFHVAMHRSDARFEVPNENIQQQAGQRQDRSTPETAGQFGWDHVFTANSLFTLRSYVEDLSANLWSNPFAVPVIAAQQRGFRRSYGNIALAVEHGAHNLKFGADGFYSPVTEALQYQISDPSYFDPGTPLAFRFLAHRLDREEAVYAQDTARFGNLTLSGGVRFDHYSFVVRDHAWSPRVGAAYYFHRIGLVLHASYDRVFQTPATENLLLASSPQVDTLSPEVLRIPVKPSRGNFYEAGLTQALFGRFRLDANFFRRNFSDYADDDVFLNTGIGFPIAFRSSQIYGTDVKLDLPRWRGFSGFLSYSNLHGVAQTPVSGGLFLGGTAASAALPMGGFPITQDQRNTARARARFQLTNRIWTALNAEYGSGLPVEIDNPDIPTLEAQYGSAIVRSINFERGRVRPNFSLDFSAGADIYRHEKSVISVEVAIENVTNRLNVIDFAGLFSGTAIGSPRAASVRVRYQF